MKPLAIIVLLSAIGSALAQTTIYEQPTSTKSWTAWFPGLVDEFGDEVTFAAGPRAVTRFETTMHMAPSGNRNPTLTVTYFIRTITAGIPDATPLWSSTQTLTPSGAVGKVTPIVAGIAVPNIVVPNKAYFGFKVDMGSAPPAWIALSYGNSASIGSSDPLFGWVKPSTNPFQHWVQGSHNNLLLKVTAVP